MIEKLGITSIFVTHDQDEAIEVADEIIITNKGHMSRREVRSKYTRVRKLHSVPLSLDRQPL